MLINFTWVIPRRLAGMGLPTGAYRRLEADATDRTLERDLTSLRELGVESVVTLTPDPLHEKTLDHCGLGHLHLPVEDMTAPSPEQIRRAVRYIDEHDGGVAVHCTAGKGRTGTVLAGYLVSRGTSPEAAIEAIRDIRPGSVETFGQESSIFRFAESMAESDP